jgi:hypothetical protein
MHTDEIKVFSFKMELTKLVANYINVFTPMEAMKCLLQVTCLVPDILSKETPQDVEIRLHDLLDQSIKHIKTYKESAHE